VPPVTPTLLATLGLGFSLGLLHALDADHLIAVSTLVSGRASVRRSGAVGLAWGLGHATSLTTVGVGVIVFQRAVPAALGTWFELGVAVMLVVLGGQAIRRGLARAVVHEHVHAHGGDVHVHRHAHLGGRARHDGALHAIAHAGRRPFVVGLVHGLAGSAALTLTVLGTLSSPGAALAYFALFGLGSIAGMASVSALVAVPLAALGGLRRWLEVAIGGGSVALGCLTAARVFLVHGPI